MFFVVVFFFPNPEAPRFVRRDFLVQNDVGAVDAPEIPKPAIRGVPDVGLVRFKPPVVAFGTALERPQNRLASGSN